MEVVLNNLLRCLGFNQGNGSLMSIGSSGRSVGRITGSVGDSLGITGSVGDSLLVSMWELIRPCSWRLLLRLKKKIFWMENNGSQRVNRKGGG